jgi:Ca2+-binding EF-hand superfamily protein
MISSSLAKILLIVACALGVIQGIMFLVGGIIAAKDRNNKVDLLTNLFSLGPSGINDLKYFCGGIKIAQKPANIDARGADCNTDYEEMDRGWFQRTKDICKGSAGMCDLRGYKYVLAVSITTGIGCIIGAGVAIAAVKMMNKITAFAAGGVFTAFYIIFIVLFALIWDSVRKVNKECLNKACNDVKKRGKKSSFEVLAYSICCFVLVCGAIVCCFLAALGIEDESSSASGSAAGASSAKVVGDSENRMRDEEGQVTAKEGKEAEETKQGKPASSPPRKPAGVSAAGKEYLEKFKQLNKYIANKDKMQKYANKKFDETDTDKSGTLVLSEFKEFVVGLMTKKKLPPPSDKKITALMKRYDKDRNGTLEKNEFQQMLLEIFLESREILIMKYAEKKANSWKPSRVPKKKDTSKVADLDKLLQNSDNFYVVLEEIAKKADKNYNAMLDIDEVTELVRIFCERYKVPVLNRDDIVEVMYDMERDIIEYDVYDLRMVAYAVLSISRNLLK